MGDDSDLVALVALRRSRMRRNRRPPRRRALLIAAVILALFFAALFAGAAFTGRSLVFSSCDLTSLRPVSLGSNSFLFARDGRYDDA